jgi:hypothetical protein
MIRKIYVGLHVIFAVFLSDFNETSRQFFEKYSDIEFDENPSSGSRVVPCGETDRHDKANSYFSKFWERV